MRAFRASVLSLLSALGAVGCNDGKAVTDTELQPQIVTASGPANGVVTCDPLVTGGVCALPISLTFRLPANQFVWKAYVRFHGDGSDTGVDHAYLLRCTDADAGADAGVGAGCADHPSEIFGKGTLPTDPAVPVSFSAEIPPTILRKGALFTYTVRLVSGNGVESQASTLTVSVQ